MEIINFFSTHPAVFAGFCIILGLLVGSFLNVVIYRLPVMMEKDWTQQCEVLLAGDNAPAQEPAKEGKFNLAYPPSRCPKCNTQIKAWQNIPVISWLMLKGKCAGCDAPISARYPIVEVVTGLLTGFIAYQYGFGWPAAGLILLTWCLISLTMIDYDTQLLPDQITLPLVWLGLIANYFGLYTSLENALWGAIAGYMSLWSVYWAFKLITGKEGMGFGDFKLLAALGAWMGWQAIPLIILLSSAVGAVIGITMIMAFGRDKNIQIPFGPYLAIAGWIAFLWGDQITQSYLQMVGF